MPMTLFDLLGVSGAADPVQAAANLWPVVPPSHVGPTPTGDELRHLVDYLNRALSFRDVVPSASGEGVGIWSSVDITLPPDGLPPEARFPQIPDLGFLIQRTGTDAPARLFVTQSDAGIEWVLEGLPVEIKLPPGMIEPPRDPSDALAEATYPKPDYEIDPDKYDGLKVVLRRGVSSSIFVRIRIRRTPTGDFTFEPAVPISIGPCIFLGVFPCRGLHDLSFVPSPTLGGGHTVRELPLEWTRHTLDRLPSNASYPGQITVRTLDIDSSAAPIKDLLRSINGDRHDESKVELVVEDLALPFFSAIGALPPIPTHGRVGIRRNTVTSTSPTDLSEYDLNNEPVRIRVGDWFFFIQKLFLQTPAPPDWQPINFQIAAAQANDHVQTVTGDTAGDHAEQRGPAITLGLLDDWTVQLGVRAAGQFDQAGTGVRTEETHVDPHGGIDHDTSTTTTTTTTPTTYTPPGLVLFTIPAANIAVSALGVKAGLSIQRLAGLSNGTYTFPQSFQLLFDLGIFGTQGSQTSTSTSDTSTSTVFSVTTRNNRPLSVVLHDIGWDLGSLALSGISFPDGIEFKAFNVIRLIIDDLGWVSENNGGYYFFFSGGIGLDFGGGSSTSSSSASSGSSSGSSGSGAGEGGASQSSSGGSRFGMTFDRLRFKVSGSEAAPPFLLDGVNIDLTYGTFSLRGFGMYHDTLLRDPEDLEFKLQEFGIGLQVRFSACGKDFLIGTQFFYGTIKYTEAAHSDRNFTYWLAAAQFSPIPIGPYQLVNIRLLVASNLDPHLTPNPAFPNMRLLKWYVDHEDALTLPQTRQFGAVWDRVKDSLSLGVGAGLTLPVGRTVRLDLFVFYHRSPAEEGLLALLRVYLLNGDTPIAYGAIEFDFKHDKWALLIGVDIDLNAILGTHSDILKFIKVTGTLYAGNKPGTFAIGHLNDQSSWLSLLVRIDFEIFKLKLQAGVCFEYVEGGSSGFGLVFSAQGLIDLAILEIDAYLTLGLMVGNWRGESKGIGCMVWIEAGLQIRLLFIFTFGLGARAEYDSLASSPGYQRLSGEFHLDTPWWLPSVSWRFEQIWSEPHPELITNINVPVIGASAATPGMQTQVPLPVTPLAAGDLEPVPGGDGRQRISEVGTYDIETLRGLGGPDYFGQADAVSVGVDSTIALDFKPAVDDQLAMGINTPANSGRQPIDARNNELTLNYELVSMGIERRPRFGPGAGGAWLPLISPIDSELFDPLHPDVPNGSAVLRPKVSYAWDGDLTSAGATDPRRLLLNSETPFSFLTQNNQADEDHARSEPGWPCGAGGAVPDKKLHVLNFDAVQVGVRAPARPEFTASHSVLSWASSRAPVVGAAQYVAGGRHVARLGYSPAGGILATVAFDQPVMQLDITCGWGQKGKGTLTIEAYRGVKLIQSLTFDLWTPPPSITLAPGDSFTSLVLRAKGTPASADDGIELAEMRYLALREELSRSVRSARASAHRDEVMNGDGKLAWLPNHEYRVNVTVKVTSAMTRTASAPQVALINQQTRFLTKGLLGLNSVKRVGDEVEPYVESRYPAPGMPLYRTEPVALALTPAMNILQPLDRAPAEGDPDERRQVLEWALNVERTSGATGTTRISQTSSDWVAAHRAVPLIASIGHVLDDTLFAKLQRHAESIDPFQLRLERLIQSPGGCGAGSSPRLHRSQVLMHQPFDPADGSAKWSAGSEYRAVLRRKGGPCVDRVPFEAEDAAAFSYASESGAPASWQFSSGSLQVPASAAGRQLALFGELDWNHVLIRAKVTPAASGQAGVALAVDGPSLNQALMAVVVAGPDSTTPARLQLLARRGGATTELVPPGATAGGAVLAAATGPYEMEVVAFDDRVRVRVGDAQLEVERGGLRDGRLALVGTAESTVDALSVAPLDAYQLSFTASRYASFEEHIGSYPGAYDVIDATGPLGAVATVTVQTKFTSSLRDAIAAAMGARADASTRQALFDGCVSELALPLRKDVDGLALTLLKRGEDIELLLLESPEPLPLGFDVTVSLQDAIGSDVPLVVLADGDRCRALLVPSDGSGAAAPVPMDHYRLTFSLARSRFRGDLPEANYSATASISFGEASAASTPVIHVGSASTTAGNATRIDPPLTDHSEVLLATPLWNPRGVGGVYNNHATGVYFNGSAWALFNQDRAAMPANAAFNLARTRGSIHVATAANTSGNTTTLDLPAANGNPRALVFATPNWSGGAGGVYLDHPIGVYYTGTRWAIFNQDLAAMPLGAAFNVWVARVDAFVHTTTSATIMGDGTMLSHPGLDGRSDGVLIVTPNWNPPGAASAYHRHHIGVYFTSGRWAIFNQDLAAMPAGVSFNVWLVGYAPPDLNLLR